MASSPAVPSTTTCVGEANLKSYDTASNISVEFSCNDNYEEEEDDVSFEYEYEHSDDDVDEEKKMDHRKCRMLEPSWSVTSLHSVTGMMISTTTASITVASATASLVASMPSSATRTATACATDTPNATGPTLLCSTCGREKHEPIECDLLSQWLQAGVSGILVIHAPSVAVPAMRRRIGQTATRLNLTLKETASLLLRHSWNVQDAVRATEQPQANEAAAAQGWIAGRGGGILDPDDVLATRRMRYERRLMDRQAVMQHRLQRRVAQLARNTGASISDPITIDDESEAEPVQEPTTQPVQEPANNSGVDVMILDDESEPEEDVMVPVEDMADEPSEATGGGNETPQPSVSQQGPPFARGLGIMGDAALRLIAGGSIADEPNEATGGDFSPQQSVLRQGPPTAARGLMAGESTADEPYEANESAEPVVLQQTRPADAKHAGDMSIRSPVAPRSPRRLRIPFRRSYVRKDPPFSRPMPAPAAATLESAESIAPSAPAEKPAEPLVARERSAESSGSEGPKAAVERLSEAEANKSAVSDSSSATSAPKCPAVKKLPSNKSECEICMEDSIPPEEMFSMSICGHSFCRPCWKQFIEHMLPPTLQHGGRGGGTNAATALATTCPSSGCNQVVTQTEIEAIAPELLPVYEWCMLHSLVQHGGGNDTADDEIPWMRWCPGPNCDCVAVRSRDGFLLGRENDVAPVASCGKCLTQFCFRCGEAPHTNDQICRALLAEPEAELAAVAAAGVVPEARAKKKKDDKKAIKLCPNCNVKIEKNGGCNHMRCKCGHHFCWICLESCGYGHFCGRERPAVQIIPRLPNDTTIPNFNLDFVCEALRDEASGLKTDDGEEKAQRDAVLEQKRELERFAHYYNRYLAHDQGQRFAEQQVSCVTQRVENFLQTADVKTGADGDFLGVANQKLVTCRRILKYTYCYTYYMPEDTEDLVVKKNLFQNHQERLERFTEQLSELSEYALTSLDRAKVVNLITVVDKCIKNVINFVNYGENYEYRGSHY